MVLILFSQPLLGRKHLVVMLVFGRDALDTGVFQLDSPFLLASLDVDSRNEESNHLLVSVTVNTIWQTNMAMEDDFEDVFLIENEG